MTEVKAREIINSQLNGVIFDTLSAMIEFSPRTLGSELTIKEKHTGKVSRYLIADTPAHLLGMLASLIEEKKKSVRTQLYERAKRGKI